MLLLVTLVLVVASAALLVLGFVQDALGFIYLSMLCAGVAALALFVFARLARRRSAVLAAAGVTGAAAGGGSRRDSNRGPGSGPTAEAGRAEEETARPVIGADEGRAGAGGPEAGTDEDVAAFAGSAGAGAEAGDDDEEGADWGDEIAFPIEDYDDLRVSEILPLLGPLDPDELQEVRDRELAGKARATVLDRIDDRLGRGSRATRPGSPAGRGGSEPPAPEEAPARARRSTKAADATGKASPVKKASPARPTRQAAAPAARKSAAKKAPTKRATTKKPAAPDRAAPDGAAPDRPAGAAGAEGPGGPGPHQE